MFRRALPNRALGAKTGCSFDLSFFCWFGTSTSSSHGGSNDTPDPGPLLEADVPILISSPPPSIGGTNSDESIDCPPRCVYNSSEKLYYKAREEES